MSEISETSYWMKFFMEAGIPPSDANEYAMTFSDNRIKPNMLTDLNKEYLQDMGINILGDVISILKHAKVVSSKNGQKRHSITSASPSQDNSVKKSSPAVRMLEHYVRKDSIQPTSTKSTISQSLSSRLSAAKRPFEDEGEPLRPSKKSSVFKRLGENVVSSTTCDSPQITVTMMGKNKIKSNVSDSAKSKLTRSESPIDDEMPSKALQYHGVLKYSSKELALRKKLEEKKKMKTLLSNQISPSVRARLGHVQKSCSGSEGIFAKETALNIANRAKPSNNDNFDDDSEESSSEDGDAQSYTPTLPPRPITTNKRIIKKIVRINKKTGQIISERRKKVKLPDTSSEEEI